MKKIFCIPMLSLIFSCAVHAQGPGPLSEAPSAPPAVAPPSGKEVPPSTPSPTSIPSPQNERGDSYKLLNSVLNVYRSDDVAKAHPHCIPSGSKVIIGSTQADGRVAVRIFVLPTTRKGGGALLTSVEKASLCQTAAGTPQPWADSHYTWLIGAGQLVDFHRTGFTFGGLVVPFKFYVEKDKKVSSSSTLAPYVGYAINNWRGLNVAAIGSAGLGLVPVNDAVADKTETKPALSVSAGILLSSPKNPAWSSGFLVGKDFLGDADRTRDPGADDVWISIFVGTGF